MVSNLNIDEAHDNTPDVVLRAWQLWPSSRVSAFMSTTCRFLKADRKAD